MLHKLSLLIASLAAALVLAGGLALAGFGPAQGDGLQLVDQVASQAPTDAPPPEPAVQVDTVYLTPQATPKNVTVTKVKVTGSASGGEHEDEGGSDD